MVGDVERWWYEEVEEREVAVGRYGEVDGR